VGRYQQHDSLSTITDVPFSGTGTSTPEAAAGNADYSAWQWEPVLATVLSIPIPDRSEVTGQPWLTVGHDGQGGPGSHLIWTAGWNAGQNSGATSIDVYLSPALYTAGGAWDRFANSPPQALSGVPSRQYAGLPLVPPSFDGASIVMASATNFWQSAAQQFRAMHDDATSGHIVGFQGNLARVVGELLDHLRTVTVRLHQQMTEPVRYSDAIEAAGGSAAAFLVDLLTAHSSWTELAEHSPLGAVVTVLEQIATKDPSGGYVIPDPQNTPYGDLTIDSSWAAVEQHAKDLWTGTLTGGSADFAGLDLLGRTALNKMVNQFAATTSALVPVVGPGSPPIQPKPVNATPNNGGHGNTYVKLPQPGGGGTANPGSQPPPNPPSSGPGGPPGQSGPGGPGGPGRLADIGGPFGANGPPGGGPTPMVLVGPAPVSPGGYPNAVLPRAGVLASGNPGSSASAGSTRAGGTNYAASANDAARLSSPGGPNSLADGSGSNLPTGLGPGFTGAIGRPVADGGNEGRRRNGAGGRARSRRKAVAAAPLTAPTAGFSIGRGPNGVVLERSVVPTIAARPPAITSSVINVQPVQMSGGTTPATAGPSAGGPPVASPAASTQAPAEGTAVVVGDGGLLGRGMARATEPIRTGGVGGEGGLMTPIGGMGGMGGAGGLGGVERQRLSYLPQEPRYWGTEPDLVTSLGTAAADDGGFAEEDFDAVPPRIAGIGARSETERRENAATDWRML
jgi:hypothetical protein